MAEKSPEYEPTSPITRIPSPESLKRILSNLKQESWSPNYEPNYRISNTSPQPGPSSATFEWNTSGKNTRRRILLKQLRKSIEGRKEDDYGKYE